MKKYICRKAGCNRLLEKPGFCPKHMPIAYASASREYNYLYETTQWKELSKRVADSFGHVCQDCGGYGKEIHHIQPHRGTENLFFNEDNLTCLCNKCHRIRTNKEIALRKQKPFWEK